MFYLCVTTSGLRGFSNLASFGAQGRERERETTLKDGIAWAAYQNESGPEGDKQTPVGHACHNCYEHWRSHFQHDAETFRQHSELYRSDASYRQKVLKSIKARSGEVVKDWSPEAVHTNMRHEITIKRRFTILNEGELRSELRSSRVNKSVVKGVPFTSVPLEFPATADGQPANKKRKVDPHEHMEKVYMFPYDPSSQHRSMEISSTLGTTMSRKVLSRADNTWSGQGERTLGDEQRKLTKKHNIREGLDRRASGFMSSLESVVGRFGKRRVQEGDAGDNSSDDEDGDIAELPDGEQHEVKEPAAIVGIAAQDLISPAKPRPPVPAFATPPTKNSVRARVKSPALSVAARSLASPHALASGSSALQGDGASSFGDDFERIDGSTEACSDEEFAQEEGLTCRAGGPKEWRHADPPPPHA